MTIVDLIAVVSFGLTCFSVGMPLEKISITENDRPGPVKSERS